MKERDPLSPFRLRRFALQLRQFTVKDLLSVAEVSSETVYAFLHDLKKKDDALFETKSLPSEGPGRPVLRYMLTSKGVDFLAEQNVRLGKELNRLAFRDSAGGSDDSISARSVEQPDMQYQIDLLGEQIAQYEVRFEAIERQLRDQDRKIGELMSNRESQVAHEGVLASESARILPDRWAALRSHPRATASLRIRLEWDEGGARRTANGLTVDVSASGCMAVIGADVPLGRKVHLILPEVGRHAEAKVVWRGNESWEVGIELETRDASLWGVSINERVRMYGETRDKAELNKSGSPQALRPGKLTGR
jgi:DNA-binding PadR family transcriptional regulator